MFYLHFITPEGRIGESATETAPNHSVTARRFATELSAEHGLRVQVSRMRAGKLTPAYIIEPDGTCVRPLHSKPVSEREDCKAPKTCFCSPCRAARRAA